MSKKCVLCEETINEEYGKLNGTIIRIINEQKKREHIYVCSNCQKQNDYIEKAKIKSA
jgi:hypothetical protein